MWPSSYAVSEEYVQQWAVSINFYPQHGPMTNRQQDPNVIFVSCSATIGNPGRHMREVFGVKVHFVFIRRVALLTYLRRM